jgi:mono/diheme cytochrome c family protein
MNDVRRTLKLLGLPVMAMMLLGVANGQNSGQSPAATPAGDAKIGSDLYLKKGCWECHGYSGANGSGAPLVLTSLNATGFMNYIRNPKTNNMPLYSAKVVSDKDAADLFAYIKTFKKPPEVKDVPLLQQLSNEK